MTIHVEPGARSPLTTVYCGWRISNVAVRVSADGQPLLGSPSVKLAARAGIEGGHVYAGSAGERLALALLLHATRGQCDDVYGLYQRYYAEVVACWDATRWVTTRAAILRWIDEQPDQQLGRASAAEGGGA